MVIYLGYIIDEFKAEWELMRLKALTSPRGTITRIVHDDALGGMHFMKTFYLTIKEVPFDALATTFNFEAHTFTVHKDVPPDPFGTTYEFSEERYPRVDD